MDRDPEFSERRGQGYGDNHFELSKDACCFYFQTASTAFLWAWVYYATPCKTGTDSHLLTVQEAAEALKVRPIRSLGIGKLDCRQVVLAANSD
jgi:hypothetical protein